MQKVIVICGPTCVGKTDLSIELAKVLNGEIINGDSMQVYKEMNIGTAKIKEEDKQGIAHHLFDVITIKDSFSVADFQKLVREKIDEISKRNKLPIIVGGTGLYLKAALYDYEFAEKTKKSEENYEKLNTEELYKLLLERDPESASNIHPNNKKRIIRALEIIDETGIGKEESNKNQNHNPIYDCCFIGLTRPRDILYRMIDERVEKMLELGLLEEARFVLDNASDKSTCKQAIGYKEFIPYFANLASLNDTIALIKSNTHKFAKRQYTWFNNQIEVRWIDVSNKDKKEIVDSAMNIIMERTFNE